MPANFKTTLVFAAIFGMLLVRPAAAASNPVITGPLTSKTPGDESHDYPFHASLEDLKAQGYVEQEFLISGEANRYHTENEANGTLIDGNHHYQTRLVVRRPESPA